MAELAIAYVWGFGGGVFVGVLIGAWLVQSPAATPERKEGGNHG